MRGRNIATLLGVGVFAVVSLVSYEIVSGEIQNSTLEARHFSELTRDMTYSVAPGPSSSIRFPKGGPFDDRLGYTRIPTFLERLRARNFYVEAQARLSPSLVQFTEEGYFAPYREKAQAGLSVLDCAGTALYGARFPRRGYANFDSVPPLVVATLLYIENRDLLDPEYPNRNPAVDWSRVAFAVMAQGRKLMDPDYDAPGGSTLATQIEKYRHSPEGVTRNAQEKLRQMISASARAYRDGTETLLIRRQVVVDYLNTVPLSANPGFGEVHGIGDGLWAWYGAEFEAANRVLIAPLAEGGGLEDQGRAYRQVLSLMIAQRRPSYYLGSVNEDLAALTDSYLRLLEKAGVIPTALRDAALGARLHVRIEGVPEPEPEPGRQKASNAIRTRVASLIEVPLLYDLDHLDLAVESTIHAPTQRAVSEVLDRLHDPQYAKASGLMDSRLLESSDPSGVLYSFTLYERGKDANLLRVQTDTSGQPFDFNEGAKVELGSTAKLRTLATYLEIIVSLHEQYAEMTPEELGKQKVDPKDTLGRWAVGWMATARDRSLTAMLDASLERRYSANPGEIFFTGGGIHTFENFKREDNFKTPTVREALRDSINLAFIRIMRDVVRHYMYRSAGTTANVLRDAADPQRAVLLSRFADREGRLFIQRFYHKYQGKTPAEAMDVLLSQVRPTPERLTVVYRSLEPDGSAQALERFLAPRLRSSALSDETVEALYQHNEPGRYPLADQGYIIRVHPLELWVVGYLRHHPGASLTETIRASAQERQEVYGWLFKTHQKNAQDQRIGTMLEMEAFLHIHESWKHLGYPFDFLVPSYATAIGSSGDRPSALAELLGIIVNDGVRLPTMRIEHLQFASDTPFETAVRRQGGAAERVMAPEVAAALRRTLGEVVEAGTARRLHGAFVHADGKPIAVGGKTGTGDNRFEIYGPHGDLIESRAINRTATFAFFIGDRHFGVITAYVPDQRADDYSFTSALPVQALKTLAPTLKQLVDPDDGAACVPYNATAASARKLVTRGTGDEARVSLD